jgi:hypothetical protein
MQLLDLVNKIYAVLIVIIEYQIVANNFKFAVNMVNSRK